MTHSHSFQHLTDCTAGSAMKVLVVLVLAVFSGCNAQFVRQRQPKHQVDMVKDAFWDYVAKATLTAEDSLKQIQRSELGKEVNSLISESTSAVNVFTDALRTQVAPLTQDLMSKFTQEAELLKARLEKDLTAVSAGLQPYAEELVADLQRQAEGLKNDATPYAEAMDPEALRAVVLQKSQELKEQLDKSVGRAAGPDGSLHRGDEAEDGAESGEVPEQRDPHGPELPEPADPEDPGDPAEPGPIRRGAADQAGRRHSEPEEAAGRSLEDLHQADPVKRQTSLMSAQSGTKKKCNTSFFMFFRVSLLKSVHISS
uniref:Apolipoprotein A-IV a n=1 Tax=Scophthalmus maximus TaxID=52904 RepID=A0A8D2ZIM4_SCOMX